MVVSFLYGFKDAEKQIDFKYRSDSDTFKEPLYHKSVLQLSSIKDVEGIIIPAQRKTNEPINYDPEVLIEHVRLLEDTSISTLPIYIVNATDETIDKLELHLSFGIDISQTEDVDFDNLEKLSEKRLRAVIELIANNNDGRSRHNQSNEWGSYRLSSSIKNLISDDNNLSSIKQLLSESLYYKKLLLKESYEKIYSLNSNQKGDVNNKLNFINTNTKLIAIIDDMIDMGWEEAYSNVFHDSKIECYDQQNVVFNPENSEKYDLIILDLRLDDEVSGSSEDVLGIENLSGIKLLKEIKNHDPSVPVIISTASNKSWSLESAINNGADGYWSKEDPIRGMSFEYRFKNTYNFLQILYDVLEQSKKVRNIYKALIEIYNELSLINPLVAKSFYKKTKVVYGQLYGSRNNFNKEFFGQSGMEVAFITISSFINEIISIYRSVQKNEDSEDQYFLEIEGNKNLFCYHNKQSKFIIYDNVINDITTPKYKPRESSNIFPEKPFMNFLFLKLNMESLRSRYGYYSGLRNKIDMIHGKPIIDDIDPDYNEIKMEDIYQLLGIFYELFLQKPCVHFPKVVNRKFERKYHG